MTTSPSDTTRSTAYSLPPGSATSVRRDASSTTIYPTAGIAAQWGAIVAGAFTGLGAAIIMATLGAAIGVTAGAVATADASPGITSTDIGHAAVGFGIGAGIWLLLSAVIVGLVGGGTLAKMARADRTYSSPVLSIVTWACGLTMAVLLAASGVNGVAAGLGAGASGVVAHAASSNRPGDMTATNLERRNTARINDAVGRDTVPLTDSERAQARAAAETAAKAASTALWFALIAQLLGLGATVFAASRRKGPAVEDHVLLQPA